LTKEHWQFLSYIRKLSNPKRGIEVVWVEGNHDYGLTDVMSHLVGVPVHQEYQWDLEGERHLAIHGHQFDKLARNPLLLGEVATHLYLAFQKLDRGHRHFSRMIDKLNTRWQRLTAKVARGALEYAQARGVTRIYCGHTHEPITIAQDGIHYYNTGAWTNGRPTYVSISGREVAIHEYVEGTYDYYPGEERGEIVAEAAELSGTPGLLADAEYESVPG